VCEPAQTPVRNASVTAGCLVCGAPLPAGRPRRYCTAACRQRAFRARNTVAAPLLAATAAPVRASSPLPTVYECSGCGERLLERRCPDCNLFARRLGPGGRCACGEIATFAELADGAAG